MGDRTVPTYGCAALSVDLWRCVARNRQARKCQARKSDGSPCGGYAINGGLVCGAHGGRAPQVKAAAERRLADEALQAQAARELARLDVPPCDDPLTELQRVVGQVVAWKDTAAGILNRLQADDLRYRSKLEIEQTRAEVQFWERSMDRAVSALTALSKLGLEERKAAATERQAQLLAEAFGASLALAGLDTQRANACRLDFARRLVAIPAEVRTA